MLVIRKGLYPIIFFSVKNLHGHRIFTTHKAR